MGMGKRSGIGWIFWGGLVSVRLDPQVLDWLRAKGAGHLTRINDILTNLMEAERRVGTGR